MTAAAPVHDHSPLQVNSHVRPAFRIRRQNGDRFGEAPARVIAVYLVCSSLALLGSRILMSSIPRRTTLVTPTVFPVIEREESCIAFAQSSSPLFLSG
jgi:hypothetical protein